MSRNLALSLERLSEPMHVAIVSDDPLVHAHLAHLIGDAADADVTDLESADVAIWDPGVSAIHLEELALIAVPTIAVLPNRDQASAALAAGARGIVLRDQVGPSVVPALAAVRCGLTVLDPSMATAVVRPTRDAAAAADILTGRERQVVQLLSEGLSNKRIAPRLGISEHTVKFHVNSILTKLGSDTRTEAVVQALRLGLVIL